MKDYHITEESNRKLLKLQLFGSFLLFPGVVMDEFDLEN